MAINVANALTIARLVLAPVFVACFIAGRKEPAFAAFCIAGFTDMIDGTVARILKQPSKGGAILDPIADKLLMQSCFVSLAASGLLPLWFLAMAVCRDVMIVSGIVWLERIKADYAVRPILSSKFATLLQLAVAVLGLLRWWQPNAYLAGAGFERLYFWTVIVTAALIAISGARYIGMGLEILRRHRQGAAP